MPGTAFGQGVFISRKEHPMSTGLLLRQLVVAVFWAGLCVGLCGTLCGRTTWGVCGG